MVGRKNEKIREDTRVCHIDMLGERSPHFCLILPNIYEVHAEIFGWTRAANRCSACDPWPNLRYTNLRFLSQSVRLWLTVTIITQSQFPFLPGTSHALKKRWWYMRRPDPSVYHQTPRRKLYEDQKFWADEYIKVFSPLNSRCQVLTCVLLACRQIVSLQSHNSMLKLYRSTVQVNIFSSHTDTNKNIHK